ncbi:MULTISPECIES: plasmid mobilization relaxosome protein MobC [Streptomyces]|uniref:plasmid mobilization relaxosome protein MobC n=1 Tax=Streptomyces TaxID=1883 RepID=UPI00093AE4FB|nr:MULTISPECIES: plasmid mobilization relaxosome protein MobC [unclassified Streptomyces]OKJ14847.1 mobilization protein [Streptomyces sp. TSRI0261]QNQ34959.1 plasmid mobilization relaxosome protein MobC [Streptomyces sp. CB00271]
MHDPHHELAIPQQEMTTGLNSAARYPAGPSKGRPHGEASAPGVAEALGHQGVPEKEQPTDVADSTAAVEMPLPRAAEAAALHRVAQRRKPDPNGRREGRVDARYSEEEEAVIRAKATSLNLSGAHYVAAATLAHVHGDPTLAGQRTQLDDYIDEINALREQVTAIGRNINQIAKKLNSGGHPHPGDSALLAQTDRSLNTVGEAVRRIATAANQAVSHKVAR